MGLISIEKTYSEYPEKWNKYYNNHSLMAYDPVIRWGYLNIGAKRWSELNFKFDIKSVMKNAEKHGLKYGIVLTKKINNNKSILTGARHDREFTDEEIIILYAMMDKLISIGTSNYYLTSGEIKVLKLLANGHDYAEIAAEENKSVGAIKLRASRARKKLSAKSINHAIHLVTKENII